MVTKMSDVFGTPTGAKSTAYDAKNPTAGYATLQEAIDAAADEGRRVSEELITAHESLVVEVVKRYPQISNEDLEVLARAFNQLGSALVMATISVGVVSTVAQWEKEHPNEQNGQ